MAVAALIGLWQLAASSGARGRARPRTLPRPLPRRNRLLALGGPLAARRKRLGHPAGDPARLPHRAGRGLGFAVLLRPFETLRLAPSTRCSSPRRRCRSSSSRRSWSSGSASDRAQAGGRRADLLLPDRRRDGRRPALGRPGRDQDDAQHRRLAVQLLWRLEAPKRAPLRVQRRPHRRHLRADRGDLRRVGGRRLRPRRADPRRQRPTWKRRGSSPRPSSSPRSPSRSTAWSPSRSAASSLGDRKQGMSSPRSAGDRRRRRPDRPCPGPRRLRREERGRRGPRPSRST